MWIGQYLQTMSCLLIYSTQFMFWEFDICTPEVLWEKSNNHKHVFYQHLRTWVLCKIILTMKCSKYVFGNIFNFFNILIIFALVTWKFRHKTNQNEATQQKNEIKGYSSNFYFLKHLCFPEKVPKCMIFYSNTHNLTCFWSTVIDKLS